ncbi:MAG: tRNA (adenosine(37)-N6)-threonylcarbamoyltransferase complex ATPase subunit type 1 TsaE [Synergistaceae bacterium]|nr:tRNA (adenosine(37)-N6)-threonylcarbamoyltransferase complex ATPase subunit type 1 TsaE [Synergistaceae bacterium]
MNDAKIFVSHSEDDTRKFGHSLGDALMPGVTVLLYGDLGAGKTVLVRGAAEAFGITGVRSPSFTLINEYTSGTGIYIIHADLYRLDPEGVCALGLDEYAGADDAVLFVEWPERWANPPVDDVVRVYFTALNEAEREIRISAYGAKSEEVIKRL